MVNYEQHRQDDNPRDMKEQFAWDMSHANIYKVENIEKLPIAMSYVPWQRWKSVYDLNEALKVGTIFPELDLPFCGMRGENL